MAGGYIKLYRSLLDNPHSNNPEFMAVWCRMLLKATYKEYDQLVGNQVVHLMPGQFVTGRKALAKESGVTEMKLYRILKFYENVQQIEQQTHSKFTIVSILNWDKYQGNCTADEQQIEQQMNSKCTADEQQMNTNKNKKNIKKEKNKDLVAGPYQEIQELYNKICQTLPKVQELTDKRKTAIKNRWQTYSKRKNAQGEAMGILLFEELFNRANESDFLSGRNGKWKGCNFDWLINENNLVKVLEGTYEN
jgi:hypothetical protein